MSSAAIPASWASLGMFQSAKEQITVTAQQSGLPFCHGTRVSITITTLSITVRKILWPQELLPPKNSWRSSRSGSGVWMYHQNKRCPLTNQDVQPSSIEPHWHSWEQHRTGLNQLTDRLSPTAGDSLPSHPVVDHGNRFYNKLKNKTTQLWNKAQFSL